MNINIHKFYDQFKKEYTFLYDNCDQVAGYSEAVDAFDDFLHTDNGRAFIGKFARYREDFITSDREAAAFMFALDTMTA